MNNLSYFLDTCPNYIKNNFINITFNTFDKILIQKITIIYGTRNFCIARNISNDTKWKN